MSKKTDQPKSKSNDAGKEQRSTTGSPLEEKLLRQLKEHGFPVPTPQKRLTPSRKWTVDFWYSQYQTAIEVQGGTWISGRHSRGTGARSDAQKLNYLSALGGTTVYVTSDMINDGTALDWIYFTLLSKLHIGDFANTQIAKLQKYIEQRERFYGASFSLETVCRHRRRRGKNARKQKIVGKQQPASIARNSSAKSKGTTGTKGRGSASGKSKNAKRASSDER